MVYCIFRTTTKSIGTLWMWWFDPVWVGIALLSYVLEVFGEHTLTGAEMLAGLAMQPSSGGYGLYTKRARFPMLPPDLVSHFARFARQ